MLGITSSRRLLNTILAGSLSARLGKAALWSTAGVVASRGVAIFATIGVARLLGKDQFGELGVIQSTVGMIGTFTGAGLGYSATKYVAELRAAEPLRVGRIIGLSLLASTLLGGLASLAVVFWASALASSILKAPQLYLELRISALLVFLGAVNGVQVGVLSGFEAFKRMAFANFWSVIASVPLMLIGAWFWGVCGVLLGSAVGLLLNAWLNQRVLRGKCGRTKCPPFIPI